MPDERKPIFIGGLERSGTSLMRAIIGSHPDVAFFQWDLPLWRHFYPRYRHRNLNHPEMRQRLVDEILSHFKVKAAEVTLDRQAILEALDREPTVTCASVFRQLLIENARQRGKARWGYKTPYTEFFADEIFRAFPGASMVHLIRDPRDVAVSMKSIQYRWDIVEHPRQWRNSARLARRNERRYAGAYVAVRYEDLVTDPEGTVRKVCQVTELAYTPDLLGMRGHPGWKGGNSMFSDIGFHNESISPAGIGRYKEHLPPAEIWFYQDRIGGDMKDWGYAMHPVQLSPSHRREISTFRVIELFRPMLQQPCRRLHKHLKSLEGELPGIAPLRYWLRTMAGPLGLVGNH